MEQIYNPKILNTKRILTTYSKKLNVPDFQRDYVWSTEHWRYLWDDLVHLNDDQQHFMGCLTIKKNKDGLYDVLDGQQRLTTVMVLLDFLNGCTTISDSCLNNLFKQANVVFSDMINQDASNKAPNRLYRNIFEYFTKCHTHSNFPSQKELKMKLETRFFWLIEEINENENEHMVFEQLNATGKPLTYADFILNYLLELSKIYNENGNQVKQSWRKLLNDISKDEKYITEADINNKQIELMEEGQVEQENNSESIENSTIDFSPLRLKKFLNALRGVALLWSENVSETIENFQKTMSVLCCKNTDQLTAEEILNKLHYWKKFYLALTNPLFIAYKDKSFELERYYLSTLKSSNKLPMLMRVLERYDSTNNISKKYNEDEIKAIFGAVIRFSLYSKIYTYRTNSVLGDINNKLVMLDYILDAINPVISQENVLSIIIGDMKWSLDEETLLKTPYSSSLSKVLLCIDYHSYKDNIKSIPEFERESGEPFQVEHMVAQNITDGVFSKYGFNVSTVNQPYNLILLEEKLNNSLSNSNPEQKFTDGWQKSVLYKYYNAINTFPPCEENGVRKWDELYNIQEKRMCDLWQRFETYMGKCEEKKLKAFKVKEKSIGVLWVDKKNGIIEKIIPVDSDNINDTPSGNHVLYSINQSLKIELMPKKENLLKDIYFLRESFLNFYNKFSIEQLSKCGIELIGEIFFNSFAKIDCWETIYKYVQSLVKDNKAYRMLAYTQTELDNNISIRASKLSNDADDLKKILINHCDDKNAPWKVLVSNKQGSLLLNTKFPVGDFCKRLQEIYSTIDLKEPFGLWVKVKDPVFQSVDNQLYYMPYINIGDEKDYKDFIEKKIDKINHDTKINTPYEEIDENDHWFKVKRKKLDELFELKLNIPEYQRYYVWSEKNWDDMYNYIIESSNKNSIHYGTIVLHEKGDYTYDVVDGQQRLTTLLNFYNYYICNDNCKTTKNLFECGLHKYDKIQKYLSENKKVNIKDYMDKIDFTVLYINKNASNICPYQVFSSINGKGKKLTTLEMIKNLLYEKKSKNDDVTKYIKDIRFPKAWAEMNAKEHIPDENLYSKFKNDIQNSDNLQNFMSCGDLFNKYLVNSFNKDINKELKIELLFYRSLEVTTGDALILSWLCSCKKDNSFSTTLLEKLKSLNMLYFLLYVMDRNGNDKKSINSKLPKLIGVNDTLKIHSKELNLINETINKNDIMNIWDNFVCTYEIGNARHAVARFILLKIEQWLGLGNDMLEKYMESVPLPELEHICPVSNPDNTLYMNRLENVCLLEKDINASIGNHELSIKLNGTNTLKGYCGSGFIMPKMLKGMLKGILKKNRKLLSSHNNYDNVISNKRINSIRNTIEYKKLFRNDLERIL